ncbi:MAG: DUF2160 family membrane protein [Pseudomonadota bacterium]
MSWMAWTAPTALFFAGIALMLLTMTIWELRVPTTLRKGWLPMRTTRGDRLFVGLLSAALLHLVALGLGVTAVVPVTLVAALLLVLILWKG